MAAKEEYPEGHPLCPFRPVIVTGTREWTDYDLVFKVLNKVQAKDGIEAIITSDERGISEFAIEWAQAKGLPYVVWPTRASDGEEAAFKRAGRMLQRHKYASQMICFPGGYVTDWLAANAKRHYNMRVQFVNPSNSRTPS